ncbi:uracil-DNA glycosylase [Bartonella sp. DGB1]|uniref:uracil-DNA glycosylase n=1 Tax=Bartonella sp. DGB1 TaxID=3239807 RepID=UPI003525B37F
MSSFLIKDILTFYQDAGLDYSILETPAILTQPILKKEVKPVCATDNINNLADLNKFMANLTNFSLKRTAQNDCFGTGIINAKLMVIGPPPDREEDKNGTIFAGIAGQLLDKMLLSINETRETIYLTHIIPWRPPGNRAPTTIEIEKCRPWIEKQIELVAPKVILAMGGLATQILLKNNVFLTIRGKWQEYQTTNGQTCLLMPSFSPSDLLKMPSQKKYAWHDLLEVKQKIKF